LVLTDPFLPVYLTNKGGHHDGTRLAGLGSNTLRDVNYWNDPLAGFNRGFLRKEMEGYTNGWITI
jgi:hypothetical protein